MTRQPLTVSRDTDTAAPAPSGTAWWSALGRFISLIGPQVVVALLLLLSARVFYVGRHYPGLIGFAEISVRYSQRIGLQTLALSAGGYDGQFAYFMAVRPQIVVTCSSDPVTCPLDTPTLRAQRILYPMLARLLAFGQPMWIPFTLLLINFVAILVVASIVSAYCAEMGASRWLGTAAGLFTGEVLGFARDLTDTSGVMWAVLAFWLVRKRHPLWAAMAAAAALLTREQLIVFLPLLLLPLLAERRWGVLGLAALIGGLPFLAWEAFLAMLYGKLALFSSSATVSLVAVPLQGLWQARASVEFVPVIVTGAVPIVLSVIVGALAARKIGLRGLLQDPTPVMAVSYGLLSSLMSMDQWGDVWGPARLAMPGIMFGLFAVCRLARPWRLIYALSLLPAAAALILVAGNQIF